MINIQSVLFKSSKNNWYLNNWNNDNIYLIHPIIRQIHNQENSFEQNEDHNASALKFEDLEYYRLKYEFLKKNGIISKLENPRRIVNEISEEEVVRNLANLKQITLEVTDACNLKCKYCAYGELYSNYDRRDNKYMSLSNVKVLLDYLSELWNSKYNLGHNKEIYISFYGGEPLLNMDFINSVVEYVNNMKLNHNKIQFSMTTNGVLVNEYIEYLARHKFKLLISLDGDFDNNELRTFYNGKSSFSLIEKNIKMIQSKYPSYFKDMVNFNSVIHKKNSVESVYNYFKINYNKIPSLSALSFNGITREKKDDFLKIYNNINESLLESKNIKKISNDMFTKLPHYSGLIMFTHHYSHTTYMDYNDLFYDNNEANTLTNGTCSPFSKKLFVTVNGYLLACEKIGHQFKLGKVENEKVNLSFKSIAKMYNSLLKSLSHQCLSCFRNTTCNKCIFLIDKHDGKMNCNSFLSFHSHKQNFSRNISNLEQNQQYYKFIMEDIYAD